MELKVGAQKRKVKFFYSSFKDFDGGILRWQEKYFDLLTWKNTFGYPLRLDICSDKDHNACLYLVIEDKNNMADLVCNMLEELGYGGIQVYDQEWMMLYPDYEDDVDEYFVDG